MRQTCYAHVRPERPTESGWSSAPATRRDKRYGRSPNAFRLSLVVVILHVCVAVSALRDERGPRRLRELNRAPESVRRDFFAALGREVDAERDFERYLAEVADDDPTPPRQPEGRLARRPLAWAASWSARARAARKPRRDGSYVAEREALLAIEPARYVELLTGELPVGGKVRCVLPDHDERTGSFAVYEGERGWWCFGCGRGGSIYDLGAALWGLGTRGPEFRRLHERLVAALEAGR